MLFRFGVILTPERTDIEVLMVGSRDEMGHWDPRKAVLMTPARIVLSTREPFLWVCELQLKPPFIENFWFKFLKRVKGGELIWEGILLINNSPSASLYYHSPLTHLPSKKQIYLLRSNIWHLPICIHNSTLHNFSTVSLDTLCLFCKHKAASNLTLPSVLISTL